MTSHLTDADIDRLLDRDAPANEREHVMAHLKACTECGGRWEDVLRAHEGLLVRAIAVPGDLADRAIAHVRSRVTPQRRAWPTWAARAAIILGALALGAGSERMRARVAATRPATAAQTGYLFVFSGTRAGSLTADERRSIALSFRAWTDSLTRVGQLIAVGQLTRDAPQLVSATEPNLDSATVRAFASMEGFYVLLARDEADALALARSCPYLRFGGTIVVRRRAGSARPVATVSLAQPSLERLETERAMR